MSISKTDQGVCSRRIAEGESYLFGIPPGVPPTHVDLCKCNMCEENVIVELGEEQCPNCDGVGYLGDIKSDFPFADLERPDPLPREELMRHQDSSELTVYFSEKAQAVD